MENIKRIFLGWDVAPLSRLCEWLSVQFHTGEADFSSSIVVLPSSRALRIFEGELLKRYQAVALPRLSTPGTLFDIFTPLQNEATPRTLLIFMMQELQKAIKEKRFSVELFGIQIPLNGDLRLSDLIELSQVFLATHRVLESGCVSSQQIAEVTQELSVDRERERWEQFLEVQNSYQTTLISLQLEDPYSVKRLQKFHNRNKEFDRIILAGCTELSPLALQLLTLTQIPLEILVFAPEDLREGFDGFGTLTAHYWHTYVHESLPQRWEIYSSVKPYDQAESVLTAIASESKETTCADLGLCILEKDLTQYLAPRLNTLGYHLHEAEGQPMLTTAVGSFFLKLVELFQNQTYSQLSELLEHPFLWGFLNKFLDEDQPKWMMHSILELEQQVVNFGEKYIPHKIPTEADIAGSEFLLFKSFLKNLEQAFMLLREGSEESLRKFLYSLDVECPLPFENTSAKYIAHTQQTELLISISELLRTIKHDLELLKFNDPQLLLQLLLFFSREVVARDPMQENDIDAFGWLESPWDIASNLYILGAHSATLPTARKPVFFISTEIEEALKLPSHHHLVARDAYLFSLIAHSKKSLKIFFSERNSRDERCYPSSFFLSRDSEILAKQILGEENQPVRYGLTNEKFSSENRLLSKDSFIKLLEETAIPSSLRVSDFNRYLDSPLVFFLERLLGIKPVRTLPQEWGADIFGNIIHHAIERILTLSQDGQIAHRVSSSEHLLEIIKEVSRQYLCSVPHPAVYIQQHSIYNRLQTFQRWHQERIEKGWKTKKVEWDFRAQLPGVGKTAYSGRVDLIQEHTQDGEVALIDFKTYDTPKGWRDIYGRDGWKDLQMPLYVLAAQSSNIFSSSKLSAQYLQLTADSMLPQELPVDASDMRLHEAKEQANEIYMAIQERRFWPEELNATNRTRLGFFFRSVELLEELDAVIPDQYRVLTKVRK